VKVFVSWSGPQSQSARDPHAPGSAWGSSFGYLPTHQAGGVPKASKPL
jgi:hypothetical protein